MADASNKLKETEKILKEVVDILHDGQLGFAHIGEHIKDAQLKRFFPRRKSEACQLPW